MIDIYRRAAQVEIGVAYGEPVDDLPAGLQRTADLYAERRSFRAAIDSVHRAIAAQVAGESADAWRMAKRYACIAIAVNAVQLGAVIFGWHAIPWWLGRPGSFWWPVAVVAYWAGARQADRRTARRIGRGLVADRRLVAGRAAIAALASERQRGRRSAGWALPRLLARIRRVRS